MAQTSRKPAAHPSTWFRLTIEGSSPIATALRAATPMVGPIDIAGVENALAPAVRDFIDRRMNSPTAPELRDDISGVAKAIDAFTKVLPRGASALASAVAETSMRAFPPMPEGPALSFTDVVHFEVLHSNLARLRAALQLVAWEEAGRRPKDHPQHILVRSLARIYHETTGKKPTRATKTPSARDPLASNHRTRASGPFAEFVKAVDDELNRQLAKVMVTQSINDASATGLRPKSAKDAAEAAQFRLTGIDTLIRAAMDEMGPKKAPNSP